MKKTKVQQGRPAKGEQLIVVGSGPISRRLPNGYLITAYSELAKQDFDPMIVVDALEMEWKYGRSDE